MAEVIAVADGRNSFGAYRVICGDCAEGFIGTHETATNAVRAHERARIMEIIHGLNSIDYPLVQGKLHPHRGR